MSEDGEVHDSDESDKAKGSEEDCGTKVSILMWPWPLMIVTFSTGHMWSAAHQEGAERGDEVLQEPGQRRPQHGAQLATGQQVSLIGNPILV